MVTIGADPEFFLFDKHLNRHVASQRYLPGTKDKPYSLSLGAVHRDNVAGEIAIQPQSNKEDFSHVVNIVMAQVQKLLPEHVVIDTHVSSLDFSPEELDTEEALTFGCSGDEDAWDIEDVEAPFALDWPTLRCVGGHIHIGFQDMSEEKQIKVARAADIFIGLRGVAYDRDTTRKQMYGRASRIRKKDYGIEYRTPSNWWLRSPSYMRMMYTWAEDAYYYCNIVDHIDTLTVMSIKDAINTANADKADQLLRSMGVLS